MNKTGIVLDRSFLDHRPHEGHPECPERLRALLEYERVKALISQCFRIDPVLATLEDLVLNHPKEYVERVRQASERGDPFIDTPDSSLSKGNEELCVEWSAYMARESELAVSPEHIIITVGASEALIFTFMVVCDPGDEVLVFDPTYANYMGFAAISGVTLTGVPTRIEENFRLPPEKEISSRITSKTKAILLCSPNNPTGTAYSRAELEALVKIAEERNLFLVVDETYREFVYDGVAPLSILHITPESKRVIVIDSLSKRFSLCGARIGCLITSNEEVLKATMHVAQARLAGPTIEQFAAAHMLRTIGATYVEAMKREYEERRNALVDSLQAVKGVYVQKSMGAFYLVARLPVLDAEDFCGHLLRTFSKDGKTVFLAPAAGFFMDALKGKEMVRAAFVLDRQRLIEAVDIVGTALKEYDR